MRFVLSCLLGLAFVPSALAAEATIDTPWRSDAGLIEAEKLLAQKKYTETLSVTDTLTRRNMRNADAHTYAAIAWYNLGNMDKAKEALTNAIAIDRGHMGAYLVMGLVALRQKEKQQAEYYLGAMRVACQGETCPEFHALNNAIRAYAEE